MIAFSINFIIKKDLIYEYLTGNNRVLTFKNIVDLSEGVDKPQKYFISLKFPNSELCDEFKSIMDLEILALKLNEIDLSKDKQNEYYQKILKNSESFEWLNELKNRVKILAEKTESQNMFAETIIEIVKKTRILKKLPETEIKLPE